MNKIILTAVAATFVAGSALATAWAGAHGSMSDKRVDGMKHIGGGMQALGDVAKGNAPADAAAVAKAKEVKMLVDQIPSWFPEGSMEYRAKAEIWSDWAGFKAAADDSAKAAANLVSAAESMDPGAIGAALGGLGKTCGGCHKAYRGPKPG